MLTEASDELFVSKRHLPLLCAFSVVLIAESNLAVIQVDKPMITDSNLVSITPKILHHRFRLLKRSLSIHHPWFFKQASKKSFILLWEYPSQTSYEPSPEDLAHGLYREEKLTFIPGRLPFTLFGHPSTRHNTMKVRVKREILAPGMQHSNHSRLSSQVSGILGKALHHRPGSTEEQAINLSRRIQAEGVDLLWQSEHHVKIWHRQKLTFPCLYPCLSLLTLALRAVPVPATVVAYRQIATTIALVHMATKVSSPAFAKGMQGTFLPAIAAVATEPVLVPI
jgi:hypothetical protein